VSLPPLSQALMRYFQAMPLRFLLVVPFVVQISAAVGIVGYLSFRNGQDAVNRVAAQLRQEASERIRQNLEDYLQTPHLLNQTNAIALRQELEPYGNLATIEQVFIQQLQVFKLLHYTCWANEAGQYTGATVLKDGTLNIEAVDDAADPKYKTYRVTSKGTRSTLLQTDSDYDARTRPWYKDAIAARKPTWSDPYIWFNNSDMSIDAVQAVFDGQNQPIGVLASPLKLSRIKDYLTRIRGSAHAQSFIIDSSGLLIASSADAMPFRMNSKTQKAERIAADKSSDRLIRSTARFLKRVENPAVRYRSRQLDFQLDHQRQLVQTLVFADGRGVNWQIVVVMPESDLIGQIQENNRTTALLCLLALAGAIASSIWTARRISRPILQFSEASQALALAARQGDELGLVADAHANRLAERFYVRELQTLAVSFNDMATQLQDSFTQLEQTNLQLADRSQTLEQTLSDLQQSQVQLIQSEKLSSLGQLVAGIAHEINNPVSFIYGNLQPAQQYTQDLLSMLALYQQEYEATAAIAKKAKDIELDYLVEDLPKLWQSLKVGADRIRDIVLSLRTFSRTDEKELKPVNLHDCIDSTLMILRNRWKGQEFRPEIGIFKDYGELPLVPCYAGQINQVFMNILVNAIDALDERDEKRKYSECELEPSTLEIRTQVTDGWVQVAIADNGVGMTETTQQKLFEPFYTTKPAGKGTGLGMSISYQIITDRHRGKLSCQSTLGEGTTFLIELPLVQEEG
jgi:signal transduction histidine kinase